MFLNPIHSIQIQKYCYDYINMCGQCLFAITAKNNGLTIYIL